MPTKLDPKYISAGLAAIGVIALAAAGAVQITTPEAQECHEDLSEAKVELADAKARLELLTEAKDACKDALNMYLRPSPVKEVP